MLTLKDLSSDSRYLVAVSGGPDSMALLDMCRRMSFYIEAAHVNYHKRSTADRDEKIVRDYCDKYNIVFHKLDYKDNSRGNFQAKARKARYAFFHEVCSRNKLDFVLVAHQKDDLLETYLMQKEKKLGVDYYGLKQINEIYGAKVIRPLLDLDKNDLLVYCKENAVPYGIDESNLQDDYTRNCIRHHQLEQMTAEQKRRICEEIDNLNQDNETLFKQAYNELYDSRLSVEEFVSCKGLKLFLSRCFPHHSESFLDEMIRQLSMCERCIYQGEGLYIVKEYNYIDIFPERKEYEFVIRDLHDIKDIRNEYCCLDFNGRSTEGVTVAESDFPLILRSAKADDQIRMHYGHKKLNRFFIDRKIAYKDRLIWPVLLNSQGEVILVPLLGCSCDHYSDNHNIFVIKL